MRGTFLFSMVLYLFHDRNHDRLDIKDNKDGITYTTCQDHIPNQIISKSNELRLHFHAGTSSSERNKWYLKRFRIRADMANGMHK